MKFLRSQQESSNSELLIVWTIRFNHYSADSKLVDKYGSSYSDWFKEMKTTKFLKATSEKVLGEDDKRYDTFNRVLELTKYDLKNDNFGKYKFSSRLPLLLESHGCI